MTANVDSNIIWALTEVKHFSGFGYKIASLNTIKKGFEWEEIQYQPYGASHLAVNSKGVLTFATDVSPRYQENFLVTQVSGIFKEIYIE